MDKVKSFDVKYMEDQIKKAGSIKNLSDVDKAKLEAYNATMRINQWELMKAQLGLDIMNSGVNKEFEQHLSDSAIAEYERMASLMGKSTFYNHRYLEQMTHDLDYFGATWSERLSNYQESLDGDVQKVIYNALVQGRHPKDYYKQIAQYLEKGKRSAQDLITTYASLMQGKAQLDSYDKYGFDTYLYIAEKDGKTCSICGALDDGKPKKTKDAKPGVNFYPMHNRCRCSSAASMDREQLMSDIRNRVREKEETPGGTKVVLPKKVSKFMSDDELIEFNNIMKDQPDHIIKAMNKAFKKFKFDYGSEDLFTGTHVKVSKFGSTESKGRTYQDPMSILFHEYGHSIDDMGNSGPKGLTDGTKAKKFRKLLDKDMKDIYSEGNVNKLREKYTETQITNLSDMWSAYNGKTLNGFGHSDAYWKQYEGNKYNEAWAEMFQSFVMKDDQIYKDLLPNAYSEFQTLLEDLVKKKRW